MVGKKFKRKLRETLVGGLCGLMGGCGVGLQPEPEGAPDVTAFIDVATATFNESDVQEGKNNSLTFALHDKTCLSDVERLKVNQVEGQYGKPFPVDFSKEIIDNQNGTYTLKITLTDNENPFFNGEGFAYEIEGITGKKYKGVFFYEKGASNSELEERIENLEENVIDDKDRDYILDLLNQTTAGFYDSKGNQIQIINPENKDGVYFGITGPKELENLVNSGNIAINTNSYEFGNNPYVSFAVSQMNSSSTDEKVIYRFPITVTQSNEANSGDDEFAMKLRYELSGGDVDKTYNVSARLGESYSNN